jgi:outer membrane protein OmpA-like peptidoglycan-associated protein
MRFRVYVSLLAAVLLLSVAAFAQQAATDSYSAQQTVPPADQTIQTEPMAQTPVFRVNVVERIAKAVDYRDRGGTTQVGIRGTSLEPDINGDAKVTGHTGRLALDVSLHHMQPARNFGPVYLTYVLWAITPEGRPVNLGEIIPNDDHDAKLQLTTALQSFGLIVTAEPYFAVTRPSDYVVAENIIPSNVKGFPRPIDAKYELLQREQYSVYLDPAKLPATGADVKKVPLQLLEARNAVAIAEAAGADQYASDTMRKALDNLSRAEDYYRRKQGTTPIGTAARAAAQAAEDARLLTINRKQQEAATAARQQLQQRIQSATNEAEASRERAELARMQAQQEAAQRVQAEAERRAAEREAELAREERAAAQQELQQAEQARQAAEQQRQQLAAEAQNAQQQAQQAQQQVQQAEQARLQVEQQAQQQRARLLTQLNEVLQTRETARGLVSRMPDVLFATNKATLRPEAKIRLAKVAGIVMAYPDLKLEIDGYTDSTGTAQRNEVLSQERAAAVRDFLISQGVPVNNVVARGFGPSQPIASNTTAQGRQLNRRVELVVSGTAIGLATQPATTTTEGANTAAGSSTGNTGGVSGSATSTTTSGTPTTGAGATVRTPVGTSSGTTSTTTTTTTTPTTTTTTTPTTTPPSGNTPPLR